MSKIGIDLVHIAEFQKRLDQSGGVGKVFTDAELAQNTKLESLAGVFAAKEAFMKAIGKKIDWHDIWVDKKADGQPVVRSSLLSGKEEGSVSISHDGSYAIAVVLVQFIDI